MLTLVTNADVIGYIFFLFYVIGGGTLMYTWLIAGYWIDKYFTTRNSKVWAEAHAKTGYSEDQWGDRADISLILVIVLWKKLRTEMITNREEK